MNGLSSARVRKRADSLRTKAMHVPKTWNAFSHGTPTSDLDGWVILAPQADRVAARLALLLEKMGISPVRRVTELELAHARWAHWISGLGNCSTWVRLEDGTVLGPGLRGVVNRLTTLTLPQAVASSADADYARHENFALLISWLAGLRCTVIDRPTASSLGGTGLSHSDWVGRALSAGFCVPPVRERRRLPTSRHLLINGTLESASPVSSRFRAACRRIAVASDAPILWITAIDGTPPIFIDARTPIRMPPDVTARTVVTLLAR